jgi:hypothetical protein
MILCSGELLEVGLELADRGGRAQDVDGNSPDVTGCVTIWLVPQMAGFKTIKDFFREVPAGAKFAWH